MADEAEQREREIVKELQEILETTKSLCNEIQQVAALTCPTGEMKLKQQQALETADTWKRLFAQAVPQESSENMEQE